MLQDLKKIDMWKFLEVTFTLHQASQGEHQKDVYSVNALLDYFMMYNEANDQGSGT